MIPKIQYRPRTYSSGTTNVFNVTSGELVENLVTVHSHRGVHFTGVAPENSLDALWLAYRYGFRTVECDVMWTSDGVPVMHHDASMNKIFRNRSDYSILSETVTVGGNTLTYLRESFIYASDNLSMRKPLPTLEEYLLLCRNLRVVPFIDFKSGFSLDRVTELVEMASSIVGRGNVMYQSTNWGHLQHIRDNLDPVSQISFLRGVVQPTDIDFVAGIYNAIYNLNLGDVTQEMIEEANRKGVRVNVWTPRPAAVGNLLRMGVHEFTANDMAPELDAGKVVETKSELADLVGDGQVLDDEYVLGPNETAVVNLSSQTYGAYYINIYITDGSGTISSSANFQGNAALSAGVYRNQVMYHDASPEISISAGSDGLKISHIVIHNCKF